MDGIEQVLKRNLYQLAAIKTLTVNSTKVSFRWFILKENL